MNVRACNSDGRSLPLQHLLDPRRPQSQAEPRLLFGTRHLSPAIFCLLPLTWAVERATFLELELIALVVEQPKVKIQRQMPDRQEPAQQALADPAVQC